MLNRIDNISDLSFPQTAWIVNCLSSGTGFAAKRHRLKPITTFLIQSLVSFFMLHSVMMLVGVLLLVAVVIVCVVVAHVPLA